MKMLFNRFLVVPLLLLAGIARADKVDDYISKWMSEKQVPGMQIGIYKHGKIAKAKGYGLTKLEGGEAVTDATLFNIGSITKQFTAAAVMMLAEEGKLSVDDSVKKHLAELPEPYDKVQIRHVLGHISGLGDYGSVPGFDFAGQPSEADLLAGLAKTTLASAPGEKYAYSNIGYCLLGVLIHRVSGKPYEDFVTERIFKKLGMTASQFIQPGPWPSSSATGYNLAGGERKPGPLSRPKRAAPSGAILTSALDIAKWDAALRNNSLLTKASLDAMWTSATLSDGKPTNYGFGWSILKTSRGSFVLHTGATTAGFRAVIVRQLDGPYSAVVFANLGADLALTGVANEVVRLWQEEHPQPSISLDLSWMRAYCALR